MNGLFHFVVFVCGALGLLLGSVLVDLDHSGSLACKWKGFWGKEAPECSGLKRGFFHQPIVMLSMIAFFFCLALGLTLHLLADQIKFIM